MDIFNKSNLTENFFPMAWTPWQIKNWAFTLSRFSLPLILVLSLGLVLSSICCLANYVVGKALNRVSSKVLMSKYLIMNSLVIDILFSVAVSNGLFRFILQAYGVRDFDVLKCCDLIGSFSLSVFMYCQCLSSVVLACDRIYAVFCPLRYRLRGYSKAAKWLITVLGIWVVPICLVLTPVMIGFVKVNGTVHVCSALAEGMKAHSWNTQIRPLIQIGAGLCTFILYICMFAFLTYQKRKINQTNEYTSEKMNEGVSLALTFFLVHISRFCLYLPGPLYNAMYHLGLIDLPKVENAITLWVLICLFLLNTILNPYIFARRIQSIKDNLPYSLKI